MAKLYFRYGAMGASKSAMLLMTKHNYEEKNQTAIIVKPAKDTRSGSNTVESRIGIYGECVLMEDFPEFLSKYVNKFKEYITNSDPTLKDAIVNISDLISCVLVDEAQFLTKEQVDYLACLVDKGNIPVICYGLRTDFQGNLFEGSKRLMELADEIEEIKTVCWCGKAARFNARVDSEGNIVSDGPQVEVGGNEKYVSLCRKHFFEGRTHR